MLCAAIALLLAGCGGQEVRDPSATVISSPNPAAISNTLTAVAAASAHDVWAVGYARGATPVDKPLALRWDGATWASVPIASPVEGGAARLLAVAAVSANDVWAVGDAGGAEHPRPLAEHWDGARWQAVATPSVGNASRLLGVAAISANDVWAVGESFDQDQAARTLVEHWDGSSWRVAPTPDAANGSLKGVAAVSASDVWAVGSAASGGQARPLALHWDGAAWKVTPGPAATGSLYAVAAASANDVWAVGSGIQHWDGAAWKRVSAASSAAVLLGISVVSSRDIYAAGYSATDNSRVPHIEHWDGAAWKDVPISPAQNASRSSSLAGIASASATSLFAVGAVTGNDMLLTARTLVVQLTH